MKSLYETTLLTIAPRQTSKDIHLALFRQNATQEWHSTNKQKISEIKLMILTEVWSYLYVNFGFHYIRFELLYFHYHTQYNHYFYNLLIYKLITYLPTRLKCTQVKSYYAEFITSIVLVLNDVIIYAEIATSISLWFQDDGSHCAGGLNSIG